MKILEGSDLEMTKTRLLLKNEELKNNEYVKKMNDPDIELEKAKQAEISIILEQILKQFIESNNDYNYEYYRDKINLISDYLRDAKY
ncbi:MAG: hypothetical protein LBJ31_05845 [Treponema sp.]|jgi:hypothetical protein|nr:hypothetical protein [Treponema sp.]